jgi:DNA (cytosine-5)-methyltransferase 1
LEALRFQGFPDEFYFNCKKNGVSNTQLYNQAGNSMTVNVMSALINEILKNENNGN